MLVCQIFSPKSVKIFAVMYLYQFQEEKAALNTIMIASFSDYCALHSEHGQTLVTCLGQPGPDHQ